MTSRKRHAKVLAILVLATVLPSGGCGLEDGEDLPLVGLYDAGPDVVIQDTESTPDTDTGETDTDTCPDTAPGPCIRYVNWQTGETDACGLSWNTAFADVQEAIDSAYQAALASGSCQVWVASGTYRVYKTGPDDTIEMRPYVHVFGGFAGNETSVDQRDFVANETILDGLKQGSLENRVYHVVTAADPSTLDGFTIRNGYANGAAPDDRGAGMLVHVVSPIVRNCVFMNNTASRGGAIWAYESYGMIEGCTFLHNTADLGGGVFFLNSSVKVKESIFVDNQSLGQGGGLFAENVYGVCKPEITGCLFHYNRAAEGGGALAVHGCDVSATDDVFEKNHSDAEGGAVLWMGGQTDFEGCAFRENDAPSGGALAAVGLGLHLTRCEFSRNVAEQHGGALFNSWADPRISACTFVGNSAGLTGGALRNVFDATRIVNSLFTGNSAQKGGAFSNSEDSEIHVANSTITGNRASICGGAIFDENRASPTFVNSILHGDTQKEICDEEIADPRVVHCDVEGGYPGDGNIDAPPWFAEAGRWDDPGTPGDWTDDTWVPGDYHLKDVSPCIDVGQDGDAPSEDAEGHSWTDTPGVGIPGVSSDMGAFDFAP